MNYSKSRNLLTFQTTNVSKVLERLLLRLFYFVRSVFRTIFLAVPLMCTEVFVTESYICSFALDKC